MDLRLQSQESNVSQNRARPKADDRREPAVKTSRFFYATVRPHAKRPIRGWCFKKVDRSGQAHTVHSHELHARR